MPNDRKLLLLVLIWVASLAAIAADSKSVISFNDGISYLAATGHQAEYEEKGPVGSGCRPQNGRGSGSLWFAFYGAVEILGYAEDQRRVGGSFDRIPRGPLLVDTARRVQVGSPPAARPGGG